MLFCRGAPDFCDLRVADTRVAQGTQRDLAMKRHAVGCAHVGFHCMAESAINIAIGEDSRRNRIGGAVEERVREYRTLEQSRIAPDEIGRALERSGRHAARRHRL